MRPSLPVGLLVAGNERHPADLDPLRGGEECHAEWVALDGGHDRAAVEEHAGQPGLLRRDTDRQPARTRADDQRDRSLPLFTAAPLPRFPFILRLSDPAGCRRSRSGPAPRKAPPAGPDRPVPPREGPPGDEPRRWAAASRDAPRRPARTRPSASTSAGISSQLSPSSRYMVPTGISAEESRTSSLVTASPVSPLTRAA